MLGTCRYSFGEGPSLALTDCKFVVEKRRGFHCAPFHCDLQRRVKRTSVQSVEAQEGKRKVHLRFRISVGPSAIANYADIMHNNVEE